jgi:hypothetical protein
MIVDQASGLRKLRDDLVSEDGVAHYPPASVSSGCCRRSLLTTRRPARWYRYRSPRVVADPDIDAAPTTGGRDCRAIRGARPTSNDSLKDGLMRDRRLNVLKGSSKECNEEARSYDS